jgi:hypothetical protein
MVVQLRSSCRSLDALGILEDTQSESSRWHPVIQQIDHAHKCRRGRSNPPVHETLLGERIRPCYPKTRSSSHAARSYS